MIRASTPLWIGTVCSVAVGAQVQAVALATAAGITPVVNCENPTDLPRVPASNSEAALLAEMQAWWRQKEVIPQMEAWWRERTEQNAATASITAPRRRAKRLLTWRSGGDSRKSYATRCASQCYPHSTADLRVMRITRPSSMDQTIAE